MNLKTKFLFSVGLLGLLCVILPGSARADIIKVEQANSCGNLTQAVSECNGGVAWQLSTLLQELSTPNIIGSLGEGTDVFIVTNNIANSFSFGLQSTGQNGTGVANNGSCQISGGAAALFNACMIVDADDQTTTLGGSQINNLTFPATITFSGASDFGSTFQLEFVSMQGTSNVVATPESSSMFLLGTGLLALVGLGWRRNSQASSSVIS